MDAVPALLLLAGALVGAGACWVLLRTRCRAWPDAARAAADATVDAARRRRRLRAERAGCCTRLDELGAAHDQASWSSCAAAEAEAASATEAALRERARGARPAASSCSPAATPS